MVSLLEGTSENVLIHMALIMLFYRRLVQLFGSGAAGPRQLLRDKYSEPKARSYHHSAVI